MKKILIVVENNLIVVENTQFVEETVTSTTKMDIKGLSKGIYLVQIINTNGDIKIEKSIIQLESLTTQIRYSFVL